MNAVPEPVTVSILDREYQVACPPDERAGLIAAAAYLDGKMREVRSGARSATLDRIAVMSALNIAHELLESKRDSAQLDSTVGDQLGQLRGRLESALGHLLPR